MSESITRVVDAHVHFWDPARIEWYPYLADASRLEMGDLSGMVRPFSPSIYRKEAADWPVEKVVHVCAAGPAIAEETREREKMGAVDGFIAAIIGGIRSDQSATEAIALLDEQMNCSRFRGARTMGRDPGRVPPPEVLHALSDRGLVFDLLARPERLADAAAELAGHDDLVVVVEHAGWPRTPEAEEYAVWQDGLRLLASRPATFCKLSGLSSPRSTVEPGEMRPWFERALELFGVDRCLIASNFPVDSCHGTFDALYSSFDTLTAGLGATAREKLFATNAERIYRC